MLKNSDIAKIPEALKEAANLKEDEFLTSFLTTYGFPKTSIKRALDSMESSGERKCSIKQKLLYKECSPTTNLESEYLSLLEQADKERFVVATNFDRIMAKDMLSGRGIDIVFDDLSDSYEFFLPWCGREIVEQEVENPADVKAATEMAKLFEAIQTANKDNPLVDERAHNTFLTRLLFCFYADDTGIFKKDQFRNSVLQNTADDGSDLKDFIKGLFELLDTKPQYRDAVHPAYKDYPYVNGGLFRERLPIPEFNRTARRKLLECSAVDWSVINPDIFGSMFQTVIDSNQRHALGQHYTSVTNIMKVLRPLFLDDLHAELDKILETPKGAARDKKLNLFRQRLADIRVFDPACGSGNFLIIAYKELCHLEMEAIDSYSEAQLTLTSIRLDNFYGIEIDDFPCEVARLALWIAQHQINCEFFDKYGNSNPTLPLTSSGNIVCGNALRLDWDQVCPCFGNKEIYVCGNPPYAGGGGDTITSKQKEDMVYVYDGKLPHGRIDYITCWFFLAAQYMEGRPQVKTAFVTTNSICQGVQVVFWNWVFKHNIEISFAYKSFKWKNNAKDNAGVTVTVIGIENSNPKPKHLYDDCSVKTVTHISPYLIEGSNLIVEPTKTNPFDLPMEFGSKFSDGGNLILTQNEKEALIKEFPDSGIFIKRLIGSEEFINGKERFCIWVTENEVENALMIKPLKSRIDATRDFRLNSKADSTVDFAEKSWRAKQISFKPNATAIIIPRVSSERRDYMPIGYLEKDTVIADSAFAIYDAPLWLFAILTSRMHMTWMRAVCGKLETRYRYSNTLVYNTFPFPKLTDAQKKALESTATTIIDVREEHYEMTMAQLYDPDKMPDDLRAAHEANDLLVDSLFRKSGFDSDEDRLAELFRLYEENIKGDDN